MDAMRKLLQYYGIEDPVQDDGVGLFTDSSIFDLYTMLTEWGLKSENDALLVGAYIEEYDINDIWQARDETDEVRSIEVYTNLYEGSYNHLRGFVYNWEKNTGGTYDPKVLSQEDFDYCINFDTQAKQKQNG